MLLWSYVCQEETFSVAESLYAFFFFLNCQVMSAGFEASVCLERAYTQSPVGTVCCPGEADGQPKHHLVNIKRDKLALC